MSTLSTLSAMGLSMAGAMAAHAATATRSPFGTMDDGRQVEAVTLDNGKGIRAVIISYGAILQSLTAPDREGQPADIVLGYAKLDDYLNHPQYFGATVGRYANRIAGGQFSLDGKSYRLPLNDKTNSLHGGQAGFDKALWTIASVQSGDSAKVVLTLTSPDGDQGYPGTLHVTATYSLDASDTLHLEYKATTDRPTVVNITNHSFFNLAGEASGRTIEDHVLTIPADAITPVDKHLIPTGELRPVDGTPFDFRKPTSIGLRLRDAGDKQLLITKGYDHNFALSAQTVPTPRLMARVADPSSGRVLEIASDQPGIQFYSGNFLNGAAVGKGGKAYRQTDGLALEPQFFPNTPNTPSFGSARLDPGQTYVNHIDYHLTITR